jgi:hypothetical protein
VTFLTRQSINVCEKNLRLLRETMPAVVVVSFGLAQPVTMRKTDQAPLNFLAGIEYLVV